MMGKVNQELQDSLSVTSLWTTYNHGYIVKTSGIVFAFDLIPGVWDSSILPTSIIDLVDIII